jgi:hypothetical protein
MSNSKKPRVRRVASHNKLFKRYKYGKAIDDLMADFDGRCAYSMQHHSRAGKLEVDHFDPRLKKELWHHTDNLLPASRLCNNKKGTHWPKKEEELAGCRFLNPCLEQDYGEQIFELPDCHILIGTTPAAKWHIRMCGLNAPNLIDERKRRALHLQRLEAMPITVKKDSEQIKELISSLRNEVELMIPVIPPPARTAVVRLDTQP